MTEAQWLACTRPAVMLRFLCGQASNRKLRLFACACCRRVWGLLPAEESRQAVQVAERFADGLASEGELATAAHSAARPAKDAAARYVRKFPGAAGKASAALVGSDAYARVRAAHPQQAARELGLSAEAARDPRDAYLEAQAHEAAKQTALLRELFGNPFRAVPAMDPAWRVWNDGTLRKLAQAIYDEGDFDRMPMLADALEEAGCADADILSHCRSAGAHARGCWVVDLLLNKS
jgi:hypothetical protein